MRPRRLLAPLLACACFAPTGSPDPTGDASTTASETTSSSVAAATSDATTTATTSSTTTSPATATDPSPASCGDGQHDPGEECDLGPQNAADSQLCTPDCTVPTCGDGHVCPTCLEQCDDADTQDGDGCSATCTLERRIVFVTSALRPGGFGGHQLADVLCNELADATDALRGGTYVAWLSTVGVPAATKLGALNVPYVRTDGEIVAADTVTFLTGELVNPIVLDEHGDAVDQAVSCPDGPALAWTGSGSDGVPTAVDCGGWTSIDQTGTVGMIGQTGATWTACGNAGCSVARHLYCVQVPPAPL